MEARLRPKFASLHRRFVIPRMGALPAVPLSWNGARRQRLPAWQCNTKDTVVLLRKRRTRPALAGLCLVALLATAGAPLLAAEAQEPSYEPDAVSHGGALYSPFSSSASDTVAPEAQAKATPARQDVDDESPDLVTSAITTFVAAGVLVVLVRVLIAS